MPLIDNDIQWAIKHSEDAAEFLSEFGCSDEDDLKDARRLEVVIKRLAREAGHIPQT